MMVMEQDLFSLWGKILEEKQMVANHIKSMICIGNTIQIVTRLVKFVLACFLPLGMLQEYVM